MAEREFGYDINFRSLSNGVRHLEVGIPGAKTTACVGFVKTGSRNEIPGKENGITHVDEHMAFMGTKNYLTYERWTRAADELGAEHDGDTEKEYIEYCVFSPAENREKAMMLLAELFSPRYPSGEMRKGKDLVLKEISLSNDSYDEVVEDLFEEFLYGKSSMARGVYGDPQLVDSFTRRDLRKYRDKWYRGGNILVVTAGRAGRMRGLIDDLFGSIQEGPIIPYENNFAYGKAGQKVHTTTKTDEVYFMLGVPGVARNDERYYPLLVAATIIGGNESIGTSRLYQSVQIKGAQTYNLVTRISGRSDNGFIATQGSVDPAQLENVLSKIRKEMFSLPYSTTKEEVRRAKAFLKGQLKRDFETTLTVAERVGIPALMYDKVETPAQMIGAIDAVRLEDVRNVADELLLPEEERLVALGPVNDNLRKIRKFNPK